MSNLRKIGIVDDSFRLTSVEELISEGVLDRPMDGNHGEQHPKVADYVAEGIPFIMANDISGGLIDYSACNFITRKQADGLRKGFAKTGDVLVTHKATIGRTALVGDEAVPYIMLTPQVTYYRINNSYVLCNRYLKNYFDSELFQKTLAIWAGGGATRAYLGITDQRKLPIIVPPPEEQRKIAAILTAYEDLIEVNKRRIALLEKMAEEVYREWFVRMRFPGHPTTRFDKGLPADWDIKRIKEIVDRKKFGKIYRPAELVTEGSIIVIDQSRSDYLGFYEGKPEHDASPENPAILFGDHSCKMVFMTRSFSLAENVIPFKPKSDMPAYFLFHLIKDLAKTTEYKRHWTDLVNREVLIPRIELQVEFGNLVRDNHIMREVLIDANRNLNKTRDFLLPRLISGKLSVEDLNIQFPLSMCEDKAS